MSSCKLRHRGPTQAARIESLELRYLLAGGVDRLVNDNAGATGTGYFTQSESSLVAFGSTVVVAYNDTGSAAGGAEHYVGFSRSIDGGATFTDGGRLPDTAIGDAGDPLLARDEVSGRIYLATIGYNSPLPIQVFRSDNHGASWLAPVTATPGGNLANDHCLTVDNFAGAGQGTVYVACTLPNATNYGIYLFRSTDGGASFGPSGGVPLTTSPGEGVNLVVGPDHTLYAFWFAGTKLVMRKSTDLGASFGPQTDVVTGITSNLLMFVRPNGGGSQLIRADPTPRAAVNPVSGYIYVAYVNEGATSFHADVYLVLSTDGGGNWSTPIRVNDDATSTEQWQPSIAITPNGQRLGIFYYSRQEDPVNNNLSRYYGRIGFMSGASVNFNASSPISDVLSFPELGRDSAASFYFGNRETITATNSAFHLAWSDSRSDLPGGGTRKDPNVYYDKIPIDNTAVWTGAGDGILWSNAANWSTHGVPGLAHDVIIPAGFNTIFVASGSFYAKSITASSPLSIQSELIIEAVGGAASVSRLSSVVLGNNGKLDIGANDLIIDYSGASPITAIRDHIRTARAGGAWTGSGITSSAAKNAIPMNTTLGVMEASEFKSIYGAAALFSGATIDTTAVLVKYTYYGDTDFNGQVNFDDYARIDAGFLNNRTGWLNGDFDGNDVVNFDDYSLIDLAFNTQTSVNGSPQARRQARFASLRGR